MAEQAYDPTTPLAKIMNAAWPEYGGNHQTAEFWNDFGEGVQFALKHQEALSGWHLIDTAPKDGTAVLIAVPDYEMAIIANWYHYNGLATWRDEEQDIYPNATHWMPLPVPPIPHSTAA